MKKNKLIIFILLTTILLGLSSCIENKQVTLILPTGTPSLALSYTISKHSDELDYQIVQGSDALIASFTKADQDIIVAPINLGAKLASTSKDFPYVMFHTIVWCNYFLVSNQPINSFIELNNKDITIFGKNSTPDVIFTTLTKYYNINSNITYVSDVSTANSMFLLNKADIILSAEPAISVLKTKKDFYTFDLKKEWQTMTNSNKDIPQAAIFVKKDMLNNSTVLSIIQEFEQDIKNINSNVDIYVDKALIIDSNLTANKTIYQNAIPNCNYRVDDDEIKSIEYYFNQVISLGLGNTVGGKLPENEFYYQK